MATTEQDTATQGSGNGRPPGTMAVENPATGEKLTEVPALTREQTLELVAQARAAQPAWAELGFAGRGELLRAMRRWLVDNRSRAIQTLCDENGKTYEDAQLEILYCADALGFWAKRAPKWLADERERAHSPLLFGRKIINRYVPYGVVGVIGPWNYPLINNFGDAVPALAAGNTVVLKPASITPLSSLLMAEGMREVGVPEGVFGVATGSGGTVGNALVDSVDMLHFTGSTEVGRQLMEAGAKRLLPVTLELGGKDPMVVLRDANVERAANAAVWGALQNCGQTCISVERVYVEADVYEPFVAKVVEKVKALRQGPPAGPGKVDLGALTSPEQVEIIQDHIRDALDKGARVETGGALRPGSGRFFEPTVLTGVDHSMKIMREETFGPTLPIMKVADEEEAIRLANDSTMGLDSSVFGANTRHAEDVARRLQSGGVVVNDALTNYLAMEIPIGGVKESGIGARHGKYGIQKYCQRQNLVVTRLGLNREVYYFPYSRGAAKLTDTLIKVMFGRGGKRK